MKSVEKKKQVEHLILLQYDTAEGIIVMKEGNWR
jgi:hypothetical protein